MSQRAIRLPTAQLASRGARDAQPHSPSMRVITQSSNASPLVATYAALASAISLGMSTLAGHSSRHMWQWTHRSAISLKPSSSAVDAGKAPVSSPRTRLALARGEASSRGDGRKIGHIRVSALCVRQAPQPLHWRAAHGHVLGSPRQLQIHEPQRRRQRRPGRRRVAVAAWSAAVDARWVHVRIRQPPQLRRRRGCLPEGPSCPGSECPADRTAASLREKRPSAVRAVVPRTACGCNPSACSPLIVPPTAQACSYSSSASPRRFSTSPASARFINGRMWSWPCPAWAKIDAVICRRRSASSACRRNVGSSVGGTAMSSTNGTGRVAPRSRCSVGTNCLASWPINRRSSASSAGSAPDGQLQLVDHQVRDLADQLPARVPAILPRARRAAPPRRRRE